MQDHSLETVTDLRNVSDDELLRRLVDLTRQSRRVEADLVAHIGEVDERKIYAREAAPSMYAYCTERLHLSEAEAYMRIRVARVSREHPLLLDMLRDGRLHLTGASLLAPHLTRENAAELLGRATHCSRREIEEQVAGLAPQPSVPGSVRRLPDRRELEVQSRLPIERTGGRLRSNGVELVSAVECETPPAAVPLLGVVRQPAQAPQAVPVLPSALVRSAAELRPSVQDVPVPLRAEVRPLGAARYKVQFTASAALRDKLERLQALMRSRKGSRGGDVDLAVVIERAVTDTLQRLEARRFATTARPRTRVADVAPRKIVAPQAPPPPARRIPAAVRRAVHERDEGQCRYIDPLGRRCPERHDLQFHHRHPFAMGGEHSPGNLRVMCRMHNAYLARLDYGSAKMALFARAGAGAGTPPEPACTRRRGAGAGT